MLITVFDNYSLVYQKEICATFPLFDVQNIGEVVRNVQSTMTEPIPIFTAK